MNFHLLENVDLECKFKISITPTSHELRSKSNFLLRKAFRNRRTYVDFKISFTLNSYKLILSRNLNVLTYEKIP